VAVLLPIGKDCLASKSCTSNVQPLTHNIRNSSIATSLPIETIDSNLRKTTVIETEKLKEKNKVTQQGTI